MAPRGETAGLAASHTGENKARSGNAVEGIDEINLAGISAEAAAAALAASDRERREYFLEFYKLKDELQRLKSVDRHAAIRAIAEARLSACRRATAP